MSIAPCRVGSADWPWQRLPCTGLLLLTGCSDAVTRGWLPTTKDTDEPDRQDHGAVGRFVDRGARGGCSGLGPGDLVRDRLPPAQDDTGMPVQIRYHIPLEILYTVVPIMMVGGSSTTPPRTRRRSTDISAKPDVRIDVVGKQWSWDFNYIDADVYDARRPGPARRQARRARPRCRRCTCR